MTYTNLPPTLYEMFGSLDDRVRKLETGPNLAYATGYDALQQAQSAQFAATQAYSVATQAQLQAINAGIQANLAQSQATVAQATASFAQGLAYAAQATANSASAQATVAQNTANGKNKVYYSLTTPGTTANTAGDIWFQYSGSGLVIGQYVGLGGTSWQQQTVTQAVIGTLDAGKITTGILNAIEITAGSGTQQFRVTPTGYLSAQGAYIKGNITADSGTFNGTVNATAGYFGNYSGGQYWSIGASGITGVGSALITGGLIRGSSIEVPYPTPLFSVNALGQMTATAGQIGGTTITSTTLTGGTIQTSSGSTSVILDSANNALSFKDAGSYVGHILNIGSSGGVIMHYGATPSGTGYPKVQVSSTNAAIAASGTNQLSITTTGNNMSGAMTFNDSATFSSSNTTNGTMYYPGIGFNSSIVPIGYVTSSFRLAYQSSTLSTKTDITYLDCSNWLDKVTALRPIRYRLKPELVHPDDPNPITIGLLAEDLLELGDFDSIVLNGPDGLPITIAYEKLSVYLLLALQDLAKKVKTLEGNNG